MKLIYLACIFFFSSVYTSYSDDLEIYDLYEQVNGTFYELLEISNVSSYHCLIFIFVVILFVVFFCQKLQKLIPVLIKQRLLYTYCIVEFTGYHHLFYFLQTATVSEIRRAYRKRSKELHPDRNKAENAEDMFRQVSFPYN